MKYLIVTIIALALSSVAHGQLADSSGSISVMDGHLVLNGTFKQLAGIEATAPDGLAFGENPGFGDVRDTRPFTPATGTIVFDTPSRAVIGVLGAENRVDFEGETITGISYYGANADLSVSLGLGDDGPAAFPVVPEPATSLLFAVGLVSILSLRRRHLSSAEPLS